MDQLNSYRELLKTTLTKLTEVPYSFGKINTEVVFDTEHDRYMVVDIGWNQDKRFYNPLAHVDIIDGKIWIQRDGTEESLPVMLMEKGVPKEHIVVAYRHPLDQKLMGFAMA